MSYIAKNGRLYTSGASEALTLLDDKFSVNKSYSKGDSCIYNDYLWKFTSDKPAGEWDSSVVEQCRIMDFVDDINTHLSGITNKFANDTDSIPGISSAPHVESAKCRAGIVTISGYTDAGGGYAIGIVPVPYRPSAKVCAAYEIASSTDVGKIIGITIDTNGYLKLEVASNLTYGAYYTFTYVV